MRGAGWIIGVVLLVGDGLAGAAQAKEPQAPAAAPVTLRGEVVDPAAYLKDGSHGPALSDQTYEAVDGGQTLALLEEGTATVYLFLAEQPGEDPNELAYDFVGQQVIVRGIVHERGALRGIVPAAVEPAQPTDED